MDKTNRVPKWKRHLNKPGLENVQVRSGCNFRGQTVADDWCSIEEWMLKVVFPGEGYCHSVGVGPCFHPIWPGGAFEEGISRDGHELVTDSVGNGCPGLESALF